MKYKALVIYGPTKTGKTNLALEIAHKYHGEIISADSRQVYKSMDIGTGKVSPGQKVEKHNGYWQVDGIKIHGFDVVDPGKNFSAADFIKFGNTSMIRIIKQQKLPIIVGGTGFYIKSLLYGFDSLGIPQNPELRKELELQKTEELLKKLQKLNPQRAKSMNESDSQNPRRLIRAIEIALHQTDTSEVSKEDNKHTSEVKEAHIIGLTAPNKFLFQKSDNWLETRLDHGLIEEVSSLIKRGVNKKWLENLGLEYRWITRYLNGEIDKKNASRRLKGDVHSFIRRQKNYFTQFKKIKKFDISTKNWQKELEKQVTLWYTQIE